jgi:serine/threonine protein phosphatase PrpC
MINSNSHFNVCAKTHVGMVRELNEDSFVDLTEIGVWCVADGMGGHSAGEVASKAVTEGMRAMTNSASIETMVEDARENLLRINSELIAGSGAYDPQRLPGATAVVLIIAGDKGAVVWAGDSRIYLCRSGVLTQLTRDHSHVQDLVDQGLIAEDQAESHPMANIITRAVGISEPLEIDSAQFDVYPDDRYLLCSDGLSRQMTNTEIQELMNHGNNEEIVQSLLHTALVRGAPDNVTLISVRCKSTKPERVPVTEAETVVTTTPPWEAS